MHIIFIIRDTIQIYFQYVFYPLCITGYILTCQVYTNPHSEHTHFYSAGKRWYRFGNWLLSTCYWGESEIANETTLAAVVDLGPTAASDLIEHTSNTLHENEETRTGTIIEGPVDS